MAYQPPLIRELTAMKQGGDRMLAKEKLEVGDTALSEKQPSQSRGPKVRVVTNYFSMKLKEPITVWQYRADLILMMPPKDDGERVEFRPSEARRSNDVRAIAETKMSRSLFDLFVGANPEVLGNRERVYYDGGNDVFSLGKLNLGGSSITLQYKDTTEGHLFSIHNRADQAVLRLTATESSFSLEQIPRVIHPSIETAEEYRPLVRLLEIATSEAALTTQQHTVYPNGEFFLLDPTQHGIGPQDYQPLSDPSLYLAIGAKKSVRMIDAPLAQQVTPALVIDPKVKPFHQIKVISAKVLDLFPDFETNPNGNRDAVNRLLAGLYVVPVHIGTHGRFQRVQCLSDSTAETQEFIHDDKLVRVVDYFKDKYGVELAHPKLPLLKCRGRSNDSPIFLPMELYGVADDQVVSNSQMIGDTQQMVLKASTRLPIKMLEEIKRSARSLQLRNSPHLQAAQVDVDEQPIEVEGHNVDAPVIIYDPEKPTQYDSAQCNWRAGNTFIIPAKFGVWAIYALERTPRPIFNLDDLISYAQEYMRVCRNSGMTVSDPADYAILTAPLIQGHTIEKLEEKFKDAKEANCQFIMLITSKPDTSVHEALKRLEQMYGILTQNVTSEVARSGAGIGTPSKVLTMQNIVNKTNVKLGGLNYVLGDVEDNTILGQEDLFIGIGTNHPAGGYGISSKEQGAVPSVVGYSSNDIDGSIAFTGDYKFQEPRRDEKLSVIQSIVKECLERFINNRDNKAPHRIIIYRNGCSEGQFTWIRQYEVPLIMAIVQKCAPSAKVVLIATNKIHSTRLLPSPIPNAQSAFEQNLKPGLVVDTGIVHPYIQEFYLLGHKPILGTAKVPRYSVLYNPAKVPIDELQTLTYQLCFGHQIVTAMTSLPTPAYVADEYAKRGRLIFNSHATSSVGFNGNGNGNASDNSQIYADLTTTLAYGDVVMSDDTSQMRDLRFNA